jgi:hypothetical protein
MHTRNRRETNQNNTSTPWNLHKFLSVNEADTHTTWALRSLLPSRHARSPRTHRPHHGDPNPRRRRPEPNSAADGFSWFTSEFHLLDGPDGGIGMRTRLLTATVADNGCGSWLMTTTSRAGGGAAAAAPMAGPPPPAGPPWPWSWAASTRKARPATRTSWPSEAMRASSEHAIELQLAASRVQETTTKHSARDGSEMNWYDVARLPAGYPYKEGAAAIAFTPILDSFSGERRSTDGDRRLSSIIYRHQIEHSCMVK